MSSVARAPGRVNLIGDHTDYTGGMVLPLAIDRYTDVVIDGELPDRVELHSEDEPEPAVLPLAISSPADVSPAWARYVAGVIAEMAPAVGLRGHVRTNIPIGAGLSSSAALEVATAIALGGHGSSALELAQLCRRAEHRATGVPSGIMDQWCIAAGVAGHALLMDCGDLTVTPTPLPEGAEIVVRYVAHRTLEGSPYADRVAQCRMAEQEVGPLRTATESDVRAIKDPVVRSRAQHVVLENQRVREAAVALVSGDLAAVGNLMVDSHHSLRDLYETSTPQMDAAVSSVVGRSGVYGARMTGGGFGGCVVALAEPGVLTGLWPDGWVVRAVDGARLIELG